jgi:hypothetical protein
VKAAHWLERRRNERNKVMLTNEKWRLSEITHELPVSRGSLPMVAYERNRASDNAGSIARSAGSFAGSLSRSGRRDQAG